MFGQVTLGPYQDRETGAVGEAEFRQVKNECRRAGLEETIDNLAQAIPVRHVDFPLEADQGPLPVALGRDDEIWGPAHPAPAAARAAGIPRPAAATGDRQEIMRATAIGLARLRGPCATDRHLLGGRSRGHRAELDRKCTAPLKSNANDAQRRTWSKFQRWCQPQEDAGTAIPTAMPRAFRGPVLTRLRRGSSSVRWSPVSRPLHRQYGAASRAHACAAR
jgi:hypothetical protein